MAFQKSGAPVALTGLTTDEGGVVPSRALLRRPGSPGVTFFATLRKDKNTEQRHVTRGPGQHMP